MLDLINYYERKTIIELEEFTTVQRFKWIQSLPSFGYDFISNRPLLGWNSNQLFKALNYKRNKEALMLKIVKSNSMKCSSDYMKLERMILRFDKLKLISKNLDKRLSLESKILNLKKEQFKKHEINNETFFRASISYNEIELRVQKAELDLIGLYNSIQEIGHAKENVNLFNSLKYVESD